jgi:hypothetical protein
MIDVLASCKFVIINVESMIEIIIFSLLSILFLKSKNPFVLFHV